METQIEQLRVEALSAIAGASDAAALKEARVRFLGKTGSVSLLSEGMKNLSKEERPVMGKFLNDLRTELPRVWTGRRHLLVTIEPERHVVRAIHRLIDPIVEHTILHGGIGSRQVSTYVLDELRIRCGQLAHTIGVGYTDGWPNDLLAAVAPLAATRRLAA